MASRASLQTFCLLCLCLLSLPALLGADEIHLAAGSNDVLLIQALLSGNPALLNTVDTNGATPLHFAARRGKVEATEALLKAGADIEIRNKDEHSPLYCALHNGETATARILIEHGAKMDFYDKSGLDVVHEAIRGGIDTTRLVLEKGGDPNKPSKLTKSTPLHSATAHGDADIIKLLIERGANPNARDADGESPLHVAARKGKLPAARTLVDAGADPNMRSKLGFKPMDLVQGQENDELAKFLSSLTLTKYAESGEGSVGELGDPSLILLEGNTTFTSAQIRGALASSPGYLLAAHQQAPLKAFLRLLEFKLSEGYKASGFGDAKVTASLEEREGRIRVAIEEGPRYLAKDLIVAHAPKAVTVSIKRRLTTWPDSNLTKSLVSLTEPAHDDLYVRTEVSNDTDRSDDAPLWELGKPAPLNETAVERIGLVVNDAMAENGYFFPKVTLDRRTNTGRKEATLLVTVNELGPAGTITDIDVRGNKTNSRSEIIRFLGLKSGQTLSLRLCETIERKLRSSGRFLDWSITPQPALAPQGSLPGGVRLILNLREYEHAPRLSQTLIPEQQALLNTGFWLASFKSRKEDLVFSVMASTNKFGLSQIALNGVMSPSKGLMLRAFSPDGREISLQMSDRGLGIYSSGTGSKFEVKNPDTMIRVAISAGPSNPGESNKWNAYLGGGMSTRFSEKQPTFELETSITPVALMSIADRYNCRIEQRTITVSDTNFVLKANARTGQVEDFRWSWDDNLSRIHFEKGAFARGFQELQNTAATLTNHYVPDHGLSTFMTFVSCQALRFYAARNPDVPNAEKAASALEKLTGNALLAPLDETQLAASDPFTLPIDQVDSAIGRNSLVAMFSGTIFKYSDKIFPRYSWPWTLARESVFILSGHGTYADAELTRIYQSEDTGPIGCLAVAKFLESVNPEATKKFALQGLLRLSASDFQKDCGLFLKKGGGLSESFKIFASNLCSLTDEELSAATAFLPPHEANLLKDCAQALKAEPAREPALSLAPALDRYWNERLRAIVRVELQKLAFQRRASESDRL